MSEMGCRVTRVLPQRVSWNSTHRDLIVRTLAERNAQVVNQALFSTD